jgi:dihydroorotate dehydrogenase
MRTPARVLESLGQGGISGRPLRERAEEVVSRIYRQTEGRVPIVGVGGIFDAEDAWRRIRAGASLVQLYSGLVYEGPGIVARINEGLDRRLEQGGYGSVAEAVGTLHRGG